MPTTDHLTQEQADELLTGYLDYDSARYLLSIASTPCSKPHPENSQEIGRLLAESGMTP